jgi:DNA-binding response OmpR family regulator
MTMPPESMPPLETPWRSRSDPWTAQQDMDAMLASAPRALVAEDDPDMRALVRATLRREGYEVIEAADGSELAQLVQSEVLQPATRLPVDVIITDVVMPGRTGIDVLNWLRSHDWATPVVLVTAFGSAELHEEARRLGAAVLDKPFDLDELRRLVRSLERRWSG